MAPGGHQDDEHVRYQPLSAEQQAAADDDDEDAELAPDRDPVDAIGDAVEELLRDGPGDVLVFLSGEREIRDNGGGAGGPAGVPDRDPAAVRAPVAGRAAARLRPGSTESRGVSAP